jgi:hypothetical protein
LLGPLNPNSLEGYVFLLKGQKHRLSQNAFTLQTSLKSLPRGIVTENTKTLRKDEDTIRCQEQLDRMRNKLYKWDKEVHQHYEAKRVLSRSPNVGEAAQSLQRLGETTPTTPTTHRFLQSLRLDETEERLAAILTTRPWHQATNESMPPLPIRPPNFKSKGRPRKKK